MAGPIKSFKQKGIDVSIWEGNTGKRYSIQKRYKDKQTGEWKESKSFFKEDLTILATLIQDAILWSDVGETESRLAGHPEAVGQVMERLQKAFPASKVEIDDDSIPF